MSKRVSLSQDELATIVEALREYMHTTIGMSQPPEPWGRVSQEKAYEYEDELEDHKQWLEKFTRMHTTLADRLEKLIDASKEATS